MGYRGKVEAKARARVLRSAGWTMPDLAAELGVSRGSVSLWTRDIVLEMGPPRRRVGPRPNRLRDARLAEIAEMNEWARGRLGVVGEQAFLAAGAALYAGEGAKRDRCVMFANSDPAIVAYFLRWLRRFFEIDETRLKVRIYLHDGLDIAAANAHWAIVTGIPVGQFHKPYRPVADATRRGNKHEFGCVTVRYSCSRTHRAVMGLCRALLSSAT